jgi:hypothetical protein
MRSPILVGLLVVLSGSAALAQTHVDAGGTVVSAVADPQLWSSAGTGQIGLVITSGSPVALNPPPGATMAEIQVLGAGAYYRDDGAAPTPTTGMAISAGSTFQYSVQPLSNFQIIAQSGSPTLNVLYYRRK